MFSISLHFLERSYKWCGQPKSYRNRWRISLQVIKRRFLKTLAGHFDFLELCIADNTQRFWTTVASENFSPKSRGSTHHLKCKLSNRSQQISHLTKNVNFEVALPVFLTCSAWPWASSQSRLRKETAQSMFSRESSFSWYFLSP